MPVSIHFNEQSGDLSLETTVKAQVYSLEGKWMTLGPLGVIPGHRVPLLEAPSALAKLLPSCDGYCVIVAYRLEPEAVILGLVRSVDAIDKGDREPPKWSYTRKLRCSFR
jgi:hypothetical protein